MAEDSGGADPLLRQLRIITRILTLANAEAIERELGKVASTEIRRKAWVLIDGTRNATEIARLLGQPPRTIQLFVATAASAGFVDAPPGKPITRLIDYLPPSWLELVGNLGTKSGSTAAGPSTSIESTESVAPQGPTNGSSGGEGSA